MKPNEVLENEKPHLTMAKLFTFRIKITDQQIYSGRVFAMDSEHAKQIITDNLMLEILEEK